MHTVHVPPMTLDEFATFAGGDAVDAARVAGEPLRGARVLHVTASRFRGGAGDILPSLVALTRDVGLEAEWCVIGDEEDEAFFAVARKLYDGLQGRTVELSSSALEPFARASERIAGQLEDGYDLVVVHDIVPLALRSFRHDSPGKWIWRSHLDSTQPDPATWAHLRPFVEAYDAAVFTLPEYAPTDLPPEKVAVIAPSIDPLSTRNLPLDTNLADEVVYRAGLRPRQPLLLQVARFDRWRDPLGVIEAYRAVKRELPDVQLALLGEIDARDPESERIHQRAARAGEGDSDLLVASNLDQMGALEINAFQRSAEVVLQKSIREGFGLTVSEALWKGVPVVGGRVGGIPAQIGPNVGGRLVDTVEETTAAILELLGDASLRHALGTAGRERVRAQFLPTRSVHDYLVLFEGLRTGASLAEATGNALPSA